MGAATNSKSPWQIAGLAAAIIVLLCFFTPWLEIGAWVFKTSLSGFQLATGSGPAGAKTPGWPSLLLVPVTMLAAAGVVGAAMLGRGIGVQDERMASLALIVAGGLSAVVMLYHYFNWQSQFNQNVFTALAQGLMSYAFGWGLSLLGSLAVLACGALDFRATSSQWKERRLSASANSWMNQR
jgi:hypothetical protein